MLKYFVSFCCTFTFPFCWAFTLTLKYLVSSCWTFTVVMRPLCSGMATWLTLANLLHQLTNTLTMPATAGVNDTTCCSM